MTAPTRGTMLGERLREAANRFVATIATLDDERWHRVPATGVWSIGKEAEHVAEASRYHQWIVRRTIGEPVGSRRPLLERSQMTTDGSPAEVAELVRANAEEGIRLLASLTDAQLAMPTHPPRANGQLLAETIERVLIGHYETHRTAVLEKLAVA